MLINKVATTLEQVETRTLDPMGYIPILSTVTGAARGILGTAELMAGIFAVIIGMFGNQREQGEYFGFAKHCFTHGIANLARAGIEMIPFINMITLAYDGDLDHQGRGSQKYDKPGRFSYLTHQTVTQQTA